MSAVYCCKFVESVRNLPAHFQTAVDKARCSWKADSVFTSVSELRWKVPKESTLQVVTGVGTRVDEHFEEERTREVFQRGWREHLRWIQVLLAEDPFLKPTKFGKLFGNWGNKRKQGAD